MKIGTSAGCSGWGFLEDNQVVATPLLVRPVGVSYLTRDAVKCTVSG